MLPLALLLLLACGAEGFVARAAGLPALSPVWPRLPGDPPQSDAPTPPAEARRPLSRRRAAWSRLPADSAFGRRHQSILVKRSALRRPTRRHFSLSAAWLWAVTLVTTCIRPALAAAAVPPGEPSLLRSVPSPRHSRPPRRIPVFPLASPPVRKSFAIQQNDFSIARAQDGTRWGAKNQIIS